MGFSLSSDAIDGTIVLRLIDKVMNLFNLNTDNVHSVPAPTAMDNRYTDANEPCDPNIFASGIGMLLYSLILGWIFFTQPPLFVPKSIADNERLART